MPQDSEGETSRISLERDLYRGLLKLSTAADVQRLAHEALDLIAQVTGAHRGYLEIFDADEDPGNNPWWTAAGCTDEEIDKIRETVSRGIVAEAVATGEVIIASSALLDPRFKDRASVRSAKIEAVLCAPIGSEPPVGVLYLEGRDASGPFTTSDRELVELFVEHLAPLARRLFESRSQTDADPTAEYRRRLNLEGIVGRSTALARLMREVELAAPLDVSVLITGETGTGKSQLARAIHSNSLRASKPFVELNCAAIPEALVESELFGAMPGAHSTASRRVDGKVAGAQGGTLMLDEIGELSIAAQAKLLQLLQTKQYYPLGAGQPVHANVRIIAATNIDLEAAVAERRFRQDLFYRLQVLPIRMPALAERADDIEPLAFHFVENACRTHKLRQLDLSPAARRAVRQAQWPGNIRQLAHALEAASIRAAAEGVVQIEARHLFGNEEPQNGDSSRRRGTFHEETRRFQKDLIDRALSENNWNVSATARELDLTRAHLHSLIKGFDLKRE